MRTPPKIRTTTPQAFHSYNFPPAITGRESLNSTGLRLAHFPNPGIGIHPGNAQYLAHQLAKDPDRITMELRLRNKKDWGLPSLFNCDSNGKWICDSRHLSLKSGTITVDTGADFTAEQRDCQRS